MAPASPAAPDALFQTYHDRIYRYILRLIRKSAEAEDLTQDTFLLAHAHWQELRDPQAVKGWLYRIATNVCLDHLRRPVREVSSEGQEPTVQLTTARPAALKVIEQKEMSACVQQYVDLLPDIYRAVILLHDVHSLTASEIAELLGESLTTVKMRLHRARRKLQQALDAACALSTDDRGVLVCDPKP